MPIVFLTGFMGAGKTTGGRRLVEQLNAKATGTVWHFVDLDDFIVRKTEQSIPSLFEIRGEEGFRFIERQCLHCLVESVGENEGLVVATGGGTPCWGDNMAYMKAHGRTVYLRLPASQLAQRLSAEDLSRRPVLQRELMQMAGTGTLVKMPGQETEVSQRCQAQATKSLLETAVERLLAEREPWYLQAHTVLSPAELLSGKWLETIQCPDSCFQSCEVGILSTSKLELPLAR